MDELSQRKANRWDLEVAGVDCFSTTRNREYTDKRYQGLFAMDELKSLWKDESVNTETARRYTIHGRIMSFKDLGKLIFAHLVENGNKMQIVLKKDITPEADFKLAQQLNVGDIVEAMGYLFKTAPKKGEGEVSIQVERLHLLTKSMRPLPEKWHGVTDPEIKHRQRYLDLLCNESTRKTFIARSRIISRIREYFDNRNYLEVETPMMHPILGGAKAKPFTTHHNALDQDFYLRIAPELYLKRLLVGGMDRVYEINRNFRNEGVSAKHNPEFTMLEVYNAYGTMNAMTLTMTDIVQQCAAEVKKLGFTFQFQQPNYFTYDELFEKYVGLKRTDPQVLQRAEALKLHVTDQDRTANSLFEEMVEPNLIHPTFVTHYPKSICPLARANEQDPTLCDRFEFFINGIEIANAYTELNDPEEQLLRFGLQQIESAPEDKKEVDFDYVKALEYGMPPAAGMGVGIDRLVMILTGSSSIRDVILFPHTRKLAE